MVNSTLHAAKVVKALVSFCVLRSLRRGKQLVELHSGQNSAEHRVFGIAGVDAPAGDLNSRGSGVEALVLDLAELASVGGIGFLGTETRNVEVVRAAADLLVGREGDADRPVRELRMRGVVGEEVHDLRDACLVIGAQKSRAVRDDEVFPDVV